MSEEQLAQLRGSTSGLWVLDPLDGTTEFINETGEFAVQIALAVAAEERAAVLPVCDVVGGAEDPGTEVSRAATMPPVADSAVAIVQPRSAARRCPTASRCSR